MSKADHWVAHGGGWRGPYSLEELERLAASGALGAATPVWRQGWAGAEPLGDLLGAATCPACGAPVSPRASACPRCGATIPPGRASVARPEAVNGPASIGDLLADYLSPSQFGALLRSRRFWALYSLAAFPVLVLAIEPGGTASWMFFYFSLVWTVLFFRLIQPEPGTGRLAVWIYALTVVVAMPLLVLWLSVPPQITEALLAAGGVFRIVGFVLGVGVREEATKLLPVLFVLAAARRAGRPLSLRQGLALGAVAGFAFAAAENVEYLRAFEAWDRLAMSRGYFSQTSLDASLARMLLTPFMHGAWAGIAGYFAAWGEWTPAARWRLRVAGVLGAALLHGAYDTFAPIAPITLLTVAFTFHVLVRCIARAAGDADGRAPLERELA